MHKQKTRDVFREVLTPYSYFTLSRWPGENSQLILIIITTASALTLYRGITLSALYPVVLMTTLRPISLSLPKIQRPLKLRENKSFAQGYTHIGGMMEPGCEAVILNLKSHS